MNRVTNINLNADSDSARAAASVLASEIGRRFAFSGEGRAVSVLLCTERALSPDDYLISADNSSVKITASGIRGFIFAIGRFLRKAVPVDGGFEFVCDISGFFTPSKQVRGHQLGYRPLNNTYDRWSIEDYKRYYLELMYFGTNVIEHIPYTKGKSDKKDFMLYDELDLLRAASAEADRLGLDVSVWAPNCEPDFETALENRREMIAKTPRLDYLFTPGADPGDLEVSELFRWLEAFNAELQLVHPGAKMTPSAQMPHGNPLWGEEFLAEMEKRPRFVDYVVQGPNRAFTTETLRRRLPKEYPVRLYPDITHNLRCETPVHFDRDDWHYAYRTALSRECVNPRPTEYSTFHALQSPYTIGSVTYSEGVNDDVNKAVWCALEYDPDLSVREILEDYARLYMPGAPADKLADGIQGLENNWLQAPENNPAIEYTYICLKNIGEDTPSLKENWRYQSLLFRAACDLFIRKKVLYGNNLCEQAKMLLSKGKIAEAESILDVCDYPADATSLRTEIDELAGMLYDSIGLQLSVEKYNADGVERGAVLDTIDLPVTDRAYLLNMCKKAETVDNKAEFIDSLINHTKTSVGEYYFSVSLHGLSRLGETQLPDWYMDYQGDRTEVNDGTLPMCCTGLFDHFCFRLRTGGLTENKDYTLTVTYKNSPDSSALHHRVCINGTAVYDGAQFGGKKNEAVSAVLPDRFIAIDYDVPAALIENGCVYLEITEPTVGFETAEIRFKEKI